MPARKHAELIKAWADGAKIQYRQFDGGWKDINPSWTGPGEYRIKPEPKPDVECYYKVGTGGCIATLKSFANVMVTFNGDTFELKSVELIKE